MSNIFFNYFLEKNFILSRYPIKKNPSRGQNVQMIIHIHSFSDLLRPYQPLLLFRRLVNVAPNPVLVGLHPRGHFKCSESQFKKLTLAGDVAQLLSSCLA